MNQHHLALLASAVTAVMPTRARADVAEDAYANLIRQVAPLSRPLPRATTAALPAGRFAVLRTTESVLALSPVVDAVIRELDNPPGGRSKDIPPTLLEELKKLKSALDNSKALGIAPGALLQIDIRMLDNNPVIWGDVRYPHIYSTSSVVLYVENDVILLPDRRESRYLDLACPNIRLDQRPDGDALARDALFWDRYLTEIKTYVSGQLRRSGSETLPDAALVVEQPERNKASFLFDPNQKPFPIAFRVVPLETWAGPDSEIKVGSQGWTTKEAARLEALRTRWKKAVSTQYAAPRHASCALIAQRLVAEPLENAVAQARAAARERMLAPHRHQVVTLDSPVYVEPSRTSAVVGMVLVGESVEVTEGISTDEGNNQVVFKPMVHVQTARGVKGWLEVSRPLGWRMDANEIDDAVDVLNRDGPESIETMAEELSAFANTWQVSQTRAENAKGRGVFGKGEYEAALAESSTSMRDFCRTKALLVARYGPKQLDLITRDFRAEQKHRGTRPALINSMVKEMFLNPRCGPR